MAATPATPDNPFNGGGAEQNIDAQKALLNNLIANQGQGGRALYERQAPEAQSLLNDRLSSAGPVPAARQAVYDAFTRDARAAEQQQANTIARQGQIGQLFMDQAKAAVPIYSKNVDLASQAMRQQFEERQAAQQAQRAAAAASSARSAPKSVEELIAGKIQDQEVKKGAARSILESSGVPKTQWSTSDVLAAGLSGSKLSFEDAAQSLGFGPSASALADRSALSQEQQTIDELFNGAKDVNFEQVQGTVRALIEAGVVSPNQAAIALVANSRRWGVGDEYLGTAQRFLRGQ